MNFNDKRHLTRKKMKKTLLFNTFDLIKCILGSILLNLGVCGTHLLCAEEPDIANGNGNGNGNVSSVTVKLKPQDAERFKELSRMRSDMAEAAEAIKKLELEVQSLKEERTRLRQTLFETNEKFQKENEKFRELQLWLAKVPAGGMVRYQGHREEELYQRLGDLSKAGNQLALGTVSFSEVVEELLRELPVGKIRQAEVQLKLDALVRDSRRFIAMSELRTDGAGGADMLRTCRVLSVNRELNVAILSVGADQGAFAGMMYRVKNGDEWLKVISVRPTIAAALLISGNIENLTPGLELAINETKSAEKREE